MSKRKQSFSAKTKISPDLRRFLEARKKWQEESDRYYNTPEGKKEMDDFMRGVESTSERIRRKEAEFEEMLRRSMNPPMFCERKP